MLDIGDEAPDFTLPNQHGDEVSLSDYRGRRVVLYFYPRADTPGCTTEACGFRDAWDDFADADVAVLGVSDDPPSDLEAFAEKYGLPFELLADEDGDVSSAYGSYGEKRVADNVFDGVFRNTYVVGPDGRIEFVYKGVSPDGHAETVLDDIADAEA